MKSYVTPMLSFESFELTSNTATSCGNNQYNHSTGTCGVDIGSTVLFLSSIPNLCSMPVEDGYGGYCYHNPNNDNRLFNS